MSHRNGMKCYVVFEEDRGMGVTVEAVYLSKVRADEHADKSSHVFVQESNIEDFDLVVQ